MVVVIRFRASKYRRNILVDTAVNSQLFERVLKDFAQHWKVGPKKRVVLVVDGAGWHLSESVKIPKGIHLYCLPSHSPQLQPAERLWPAGQ